MVLHQELERLVRQPIDEEAVVREVRHHGAGAVLTFSGTVRAANRGREVVGIDYHAYEPMAAREIVKIERDIASRWPQVKCCIVHRIGPLELGEASVFLAVSSPHRGDGFEALRFGIDTLKKTVPIWKREVYSDGEAWLEGS